MSTKIKISSDTLQILKLASQINSSIKFESGNIIRTRAENNSVLLEAEVAEEFPETFAIYELNRFLGVLNLPNMKDAELEFTESDKVIIKSGRSKVNYYFTAVEFVEDPDRPIYGKPIPVLDEVVNVKLNQQTIEHILKAASTLNHKILEFRVENSNLSIAATTPEVESSNDMVIDFGDVESDDGVYRVKLEYIKLIPGNWDVSVQIRPTDRKGMCKFTHENGHIIECVALEDL